MARTELKSVVADEIPRQFKQSLMLLDHLNWKTLEILDKTTDYRVQLQAIAVFKEICFKESAAFPFNAVRSFGFVSRALSKYCIASCIFPIRLSSTPLLFNALMWF